MVELTYRDWKRIGFQVKLGERASGTNAVDDPTFNEKQVGRLFGWEGIPYVSTRVTRPSDLGFEERPFEEGKELDDIYDLGDYDGD